MLDGGLCLINMFSTDFTAVSKRTAKSVAKYYWRPDY